MLPNYHVYFSHSHHILAFFFKLLLLVVTDKINKSSTLGKAEAAEDNLLCQGGSLAQGKENKIGFRGNKHTNKQSELKC